MQNDIGAAEAAPMERNCFKQADDHGAHEGRVVVPPGPGELQRDLVVCIERPAPRLVAAQQRVTPRSDNELVARIVAAGSEDRRMLGGQYLALVGPGADRAERRRVGGVRQRSSATHAGDLLGRLHRPQPWHEV